MFTVIIHVFTGLIHVFTGLIHVFTGLIHMFSGLILIHMFSGLIHVLTGLIHVFTGLIHCKLILLVKGIHHSVDGGRAQQQNKCPVAILLLKLPHENKLLGLE